ncbi:MAG TPA: dicarboxylate/amino acid:cation symporter [Terriglobales bacterium]|nr:dicarboxylate/amino acid:cation symporter [Terriglobales bacterium]
MSETPERQAVPPADAFERELTTDLKDSTPDRPRGLPLHTRILIGLGVGVGAGFGANLLLGGEHWAVEWAVRNISEPVGTLFLRMLLMIVIPLVFSALVVGVAGVGDIRKLGRVGLRTIGFTLVLSAISVAIGLGLANTVRPGKRIDSATETALRQRYGSEAATRVAAAKAGTEKDSALMTVVKTLVPANPFSAISPETPNMLHLMFFAVLVGVALTLIPQTAAAPVVAILEGVFQVSAKIVDIVMRMAPYAVACLLFTNTARFGLDLLQALAWFMITVLVGLALHMFGVYSLALALLARIHPMEFFRRVKTAMLTAFSTSSSNATLPTALRVGEENLGAPPEINSFVLTVGATANQNGTALYEGVTVLFLAQLAGVDLSLGQQLLVLYLAILGGVGTAGVPSGSIPFIVVVLATVGVDPGLIAVILGVDRILDMCRTTLNVTGDLVAVAYVARAEGYELLREPVRVAASAVTAKP